MLNYMRSEYYHIRRNRAYLGTVLVLAGIMLTAIICMRQFSKQFHLQTSLGLEFFPMMTSSFAAVACLSICFCFFINCGSSWKGVLSAMGIIYVLPEVFQLIGFKLPKLNALWRYSPHNMLCAKPEAAFFWDTASGMAQCYIIGILHTILFTAIGIYWMQKREIR